MIRVYTRSELFLPEDYRDFDANGWRVGNSDELTVFKYDAEAKKGEDVAVFADGVWIYVVDIGLTGEISKSNG